MNQLALSSRSLREQAGQLHCPDSNRHSLRVHFLSRTAMTAPYVWTSCPTREQLDAFCSRRMESPLRQRLMPHIARCADCRGVVLASRSRPTRRRAIAAAIAVVALISISLTHERRPILRGTSAHADLPALESAVRQETESEGIDFGIERSTNLVLLVDLARAYLAVDSPAEPLAQIIRAFAAASRASSLDPQNEDALFHRALTLEKLGLRTDAVQAWLLYLRTSTGEQGADAARRHLSQLRRTRSRWSVEARSLKPAALPDAVLNDSQSARGYAEDELLPEWGRLYLAGEEAAAEKVLQTAEEISRLLVRITGDRMLEEQIARIRTAKLTKHAAEAHASYGLARKAFRKSPDDNARPALQRAVEQLTGIHSPLAYRAAMYVATIDQYGGRNMEASRTLSAMLQRLAPNRQDFPSLTGQLEWTAGLCSFTRGDYDQALLHYRAAEKSFSANQDLANLAGVAAVTAECLRFLGYDEEAWREMIRAAELSSSYASKQRRYLVLSECMRLATEHQYFGMARYFSDLVRVAGRQSGDAVLECDALLSRAKLDRISGNAIAAMQSARSADQIAASIPDSGMRKRLSCRIAIEKGASLASTDPRAALRQLNSAEELATEIELAVYQPEIHQRKGEAFAALANRDAAVAEFQRGIDVCAALAPNQNPTDRATFARVRRQLSDRLIAMTIDADEERAWKTAIAARDYASVPERAPDQATALLTYHILDDELLLWVVRHDRRMLVRRRIPSNQLREDIRTFVDALRRAETLTAADAESQRIYDLVVRPALPHLSGTNRLLVLPDGSINDVPFSVLRNQVDGRRLFERWELSILAPIRAEPLRTQKPLTPEQSSLFIVAAPDVPSLAPLRGALEEGNRLAAQWPQSSLRTGVQATPDAFLRGASSHDIVHFAGHVTHHHDPNLAALRLAPHENDDGRLTGTDLAALSARPPSMVVLSSCAAASGRPSAFGPLSVVRPILSSGVPVVVASLWNVDDGSAAPLMLRFYAELTLGRSPSAALRNAQLASNHQALAPRHWAAFQVYINQQFD
jgi:CHAT domain-containing protein